MADGPDRNKNSQLCIDTGGLLEMIQIGRLQGFPYLNSQDFLGT